MSRRSAAGVFMTAALLGMAAPAHALRCGNYLVAEGDPSTRLRQVCGAPAHIERIDERIPVRRYDPRRDEYYNDSVIEPYEIWTYNFGPRRFMMRIVVRRGVVTDIQSLGYGY